MSGAQQTPQKSGEVRNWPIILFCSVVVIAAVVLFNFKLNEATERMEGIVAGGPAWFATDAGWDINRRLTGTVRGEVGTMFGDEFIAAAPTWTHPIEPQCSDGEPRWVEDCLAESNVPCAMRCCGKLAQRLDTLGAPCRIRVRAALGPPAPYPPSPTSSNP